MHKSKLKTTVLLSLFAMLLSATAIVAQTPRASDRQLQALVGQIQMKTNTLRTQVNRNRRNVPAAGDQINIYITDMARATADYRMSLNQRRATADQVREILQHAAGLDQYISMNATAPAVTNQWNALKRDINTLAGYYSITNWDQQGQMPGWGGNRGGWDRMLDNRLTGTYRLNQSLSDNVDSVLNRSYSNVAVNNRNRMRQGLRARLTAPTELAIEKQGENFTVASNIAAPVTVELDGQARRETLGRQTVTTTASMTGQTITISTEGDRANDFWLTFAVDANNRLRVTRRVYLENQNQTVTVNSVYDKINNSAQWPNIIQRPGMNEPGRNNNTQGTNAFFIPNGTQVTAVLRTPIDSSSSQPGDRFQMEVTSPSQYRGAIIEGHVMDAEGSGRVSGRANLSLDFDTIRVNNRTYQFAGIIDSAREANGGNINVNNEGTVRDDNQTTRTVTRAGVGAALGALIGAIAGGGSGAAIGAGIGAGAGAGTVLIQGRDNLRLEPGSTFMITASAPQNTNWQNR
ncbi:MAG: hypothetical protein H0V76_06415 [Blastocatellia bacterium]|nr:hypothetical protein [Blastocatellia bacterium]